MNLKSRKRLSLLQVLSELHRQPFFPRRAGLLPRLPGNLAMLPAVAFHLNNAP